MVDAHRQEPAGQSENSSDPQAAIGGFGGAEQRAGAAESEGQVTDAGDRALAAHGDLLHALVHQGGAVVVVAAEQLTVGFQLIQGVAGRGDLAPDEIKTRTLEPPDAARPRF